MCGFVTDLDNQTITQLITSSLIGDLDQGLLEGQQQVVQNFVQMLIDRV